MQPDRSWKALLDPGSATDFFPTEQPLPAFTVTPDYSAVNALWCSELSRLAYKENEGERKAILRRAGLVEIRFFDSKGTQAMLAYSKALDVAFLAFRGSSEFLDWVANLRVIPTLWRDGSYVHRGFKNALECVWDEVKAELDKTDCPLYICGHSLGGALTLLTSSLHKPMAAYTFGCPPVGSIGFVSSLDDQHIYRVTHGRDFVPDQLPTFRHAGELVELEEIKFGWSLRKPPPRMRCHIPQLYSCALERLL